MPLAKTLQRKLRLPVFVESDRNAVVLGETWRGAARNRRDAIVLIVGTGIGAGIVSDGRLVRGAHELSGCAGWLVVTDEQNEDSRRCGSLEALAAGPAIARAFDDTTPAAAAAARNGDRRAVDIFHRAGRLLGKAVANLISLFDPEVIVLTGGMSNTADIWMDALQHAVAEHAQPLSAPKVRIAVSKLQTDANLLGAAKLALDGVRLSPAAAGSRPAAAGKRTKRTAARRPRAAGGDARNPKNSKRRKSSR